MRFEYKERTKEDEVVAFIHQSGALIVKVEDPTDEVYCEVVGYGVDTKEWWYKWLKRAKRKFYRGDRVTIIFEEES